MATVIDELLVSLGFNADTSGADRFNKKLGGVISTFGKVGAAVVGAGTLISGFLGKSLLDTASQFEKFETQLTTIEGSSEKAKESLAWISEFGAKTPYDVAGVTEAFVKLKSYGLDPIEGGLLESLGNTASAMGKSLDQATEMIADAVRGENERLKEFGIVGSKGNGEITYSYTLNGESLQKTVKDDSIEIQKGLQDIFDSKFAGGMEAMSKTWDGLVSNMGDRWTAFKKRISERGAFDRLKGYLENVSDALNENADAIDDFADKIGDNLVSAFEWLEEVMFKVWDGTLWARDAFAELDKQFGLSEKSAAIFAVALGLIVANMAGLAALKAVSSIMSLASGFSMLLNPIALVGALLIGFFLVAQDIYGFLNGQDSLIGSLMEGHPELKAIFDLLVEKAMMIVDVIKKIWTDNEESFNALFEAFGGLIEALAPLVDLFFAILPDVVSLFLDIALVAIELLSVAIGGLVAIFTLLIKNITFIWKNLWKVLSWAFEGFFDYFLFKVKAILGYISGVAKTIRAVMSGDFKDGFNILRETSLKAGGQLLGIGQHSYANSGKGSAKNQNGGAMAGNQSTVTQHINVASANEAAIVANRTAQGTRQQSNGYQ